MSRTGGSRRQPGDGAKLDRRVRRTVAMAMIASALVVWVPAAVAAPSFRWSGASPLGTSWELGGNWEGGTAPIGSVDRLTFPELNNTQCVATTGKYSCYDSESEPTFLRVESIFLDDAVPYGFDGSQIELGGGGVRASPTGGSGSAQDELNMPITLTAPQIWGIFGRASAAQSGQAGLSVSTVFGDEPLTIGLNEQAGLTLDTGDIETGPIAIVGADPRLAGVANGVVTLAGDRYDGLAGGGLNARTGEPVELGHIELTGYGKVGELSTNDVELNVAGEDGRLEAEGVDLDPASDLSFDMFYVGTRPEQYDSELVANGPIRLEGAKLSLVAEAPCPALLHGQTYTFVSAEGALSGSFANAPEGTVLPVDFAGECDPSPPVTMRITYHRASYPQTVTGTVEQGRPVYSSPITGPLDPQGGSQVSTDLFYSPPGSSGNIVPDARLVSSDLRSSPSGAVSVKVRCPIDESRCAGTVTLRTVGAIAASNARVGRTRAAVLTLARHAFAVDGGGVTTVVLHLSAAARNLLARAHVMHVRATVFAEDDAGNVHTRQAIVTLHAPAAAHRNG